MHRRKPPSFTFQELKGAALRLLQRVAANQKMPLRSDDRHILSLVLSRFIVTPTMSIIISKRASLIPGKARL